VSLKNAMPNPHSSDAQDKFTTPNDRRSYTIARADLPLHCPLPGMSLWDSHPLVYIPIEDSKKGRMRCPYCSTEYVLEPE